MTSVQGRAHRIIAASNRPGIAVFLAAGIMLGNSTGALAAKAAKPSLARDQASFVSAAALLQEDAGTPIGPVKKIVICHNGQSIRVAERAVPAHLAHGDSLGECEADVVVCRQRRTIITQPSKVRPTDVPGPCENQLFMCNLRLRNIVVQPDRVSEHLARGHRLGLCPGRNLLCHKGRTLVVNDGDYQRHLANHSEDYPGYCLGGPGPIITEDQLPPQVGGD